MFTDTVSTIIIEFHKVFDQDCKVNINYLDCVVNSYVQLVTYGIICPIIYLLFVYNLLLNRQLTTLFYVFCLVFLTHF